MVFSLRFIFLVLLISNIVFIRGQSGQKNIRERIIVKILSNYDPNLSPYYLTGDQLNVGISTTFYSTVLVEDINMVMNIGVYLKLYWTDFRLQFDDEIFANVSKIGVDYVSVGKIWKPDVTIMEQNNAAINEAAVPNSAIWIWKNGSVVWSRNISVKISCSICFDVYPHDRHECRFRLRSYVSPLKELRLYWLSFEEKPESGGSHWNKFQLENHELYVMKCSNWENDLWSEAGVRFTFRRVIGYFYAGSLIPGTLLVVMSWVSFWINYQSAPARIALATGLVLAEVTSMSAQEHHNVFRTAGIGAIQIWDIGVFVMLFACLAQYAVVSVLARQKQPFWNQTSTEKDANFDESHKQPATSNDCPVTSFYGHKLAVRDMENKVKRFQNDLHNCVGYIQEPKLLKENIKALYRKHVQRGDWEETAALDQDIQAEFERQKKHLEKTVTSLRKQLDQDSKTHKADNVRIMQENVSLLKEINDLRKELKISRSQVHDLEIALGQHSGIKKPEDHRELLNAVRQTNKNAIMEDDVRRCKRVIDVQKSEITRLRGALRTASAKSRVAFTATMTADSGFDDQEREMMTTAWATECELEECKKIIEKQSAEIQRLKSAPPSSRIQRPKISTTTVTGSSGFISDTTSKVPPNSASLQLRPQTSKIL